MSGPIDPYRFAVERALKIGGAFPCRHSETVSPQALTYVTVERAVHPAVVFALCAQCSAEHARLLLQVHR